MNDDDANGARRAFEQIVAGLDSPMLIVTTAAGAERAGCLVGFATQCSIDPARYAVFISKTNETGRVATRAETMVVHTLGLDDKPLARLFGEQTSDEVPKFERCRWQVGPGGVPVLDGCDWFAGRIADRVDVGDHVLYLLDVVDDGRSIRAGAGHLGFQALRDLEAGHHP